MKPASIKKQAALRSMGDRVLAKHYRDLLHWLDAGWTVLKDGTLVPPCAKMMRPFDGAHLLDPKETP